MKKEKMLRSMELLDDKYVEEAAPHKKKSKKRFIKFGVLAACLALLTSLGLWLFIPFSTEPPDVSEYSDSQYYQIINKLNAITYSKSRYKNNFEKIFSGVAKKDAMNESVGIDMNTGMSPSSDDTGTGNAGSESGNYKEVTDNQVAGVIEADLIKRSDRYIYYLNNIAGELLVYSIDGENSEKVGSYNLKAGKSKTYINGEMEFYLSKDCKTVTVIAQYYDGNTDCVSLISLDVSDVTNIKEKNRVSFSGFYNSSRMVNGYILLINNFYVSYNPDFSDETQFIPQIDTGDGMKSIPADAIICPDELNSTGYTVVCKLDENTLELQGTSAFLSYSSEVYVSTDSIYATRGYTVESKDGNTVVQTSMTDISRLIYTGDAFEDKGSVTVDGYVNDQYSLDEYNGVLRVVTTENVWKYKESYRNYGDGTVVSVSDSGSYQNASIFLIDADSMEVLSGVRNFAPDGESVRSVRFDRDSAYVCTSIQLRDPVFFFDLSDTDNITYKETGTIEGFSTSLVNLGDGYLLGIGVGSSSGTLKVEIYTEYGDKVVSVCKYEIDNCYFSSDYKSYYIDRENKLVGIGYYLYGYNYSSSGKTQYYETERYVLLHFDGNKLTAVTDSPLAGEPTNKRGVLVDSYFYMFGNSDFKVEKITLN